MSECGVCLYANESDCLDYIDEAEIVTLDHDESCCECEKLIPAGNPIEEARFMSAPSPLYTCIVCAEIANAFYCDGRIYGGELWEALAEVFDQLNQSCFDRLTTPAAKAELQRRWMSWKGL